MSQRNLKPLDVSKDDRAIVLSTRVTTLMTVAFRNVMGAQKKRLGETLDFIEQPIATRAGDEMKSLLKSAMKTTAFLATNSQHVGARAVVWREGGNTRNLFKRRHPRPVCLE